MAAMGIERVEGVKDPEDHIASLFDIMSGLIRGAFDAPSDLAAQAEFSTHRAVGATSMQDIEGAKAAVFFAPVGSMAARSWISKARLSVWARRIANGSRLTMASRCLMRRHFGG